MAEIRVDAELEGLDDVLEVLDRERSRTRFETEAEVENTSNLIEETAKRNAPVGADATLRTETGVRRPSGLSAEIGLFGKPAYAQWAHDGRDPGTRPPTDEGGELWRWVERKLRVPAEEMRSVTFLVARKIGQEGTEGEPFLLDAYEEHAPGFPTRLARRLNRI